MTTGGHLELPWPAKELSPNARIHHMAKAKATKAAREQAYWLTRIAEPPKLNDGPIIVDMTFHPPDRRRRDLDTMLSSSKAALDGIADALAVNDNRFEFRIRRAEPCKNGRIVVVLAGEG